MLETLKNLVCNKVFDIWCEDYDAMSERRNAIIEYMANNNKEGTYYIQQFQYGEEYTLTVECRYKDYYKLIDQLQLVKLGSGRNWC